MELLAFIYLYAHCWTDGMFCRCLLHFTFLFFITVGLTWQPQNGCHFFLSQPHPKAAAAVAPEVKYTTQGSPTASLTKEIPQTGPKMSFSFYSQVQIGLILQRARTWMSEILHECAWQHVGTTHFTAKLSYSPICKVAYSPQSRHTYRKSIVLSCGVEIECVLCLLRVLLKQLHHQPNEESCVSAKFQPLFQQPKKTKKSTESRLQSSRRLTLLFICKRQGLMRAWLNHIKVPTECMLISQI